MSFVSYLCGGCGKSIVATSLAALGPLPAGWLVADDDPTMTACSADCVDATRRAAKAYWQAWLDKRLERIDAAVFRRGGSVR